MGQCHLFKLVLSSLACNSREGKTTVSSTVLNRIAFCTYKSLEHSSFFKSEFGCEMGVFLKIRVF